LNYVIRKVTIATNFISTIAGKNVRGYNGDTGSATSAEIGYVYSLSIDVEQNLYISDYAYNVIRKVNLLTNIITTVAGGTGSTAFNGDNILAINANIAGPYGIRCDTVGNIYFSDNSNYRIRKITISTNIITTIAGNGGYGYNGDNIKATDAQITSHIYLTIDTNGHVFFTDYANHRIRKIDFFTRFFFFFFSHTRTVNK
jgi:hypothetical protein